MNKQRKERKARYDRNVIYDARAKQMDRKEFEYEIFLKCAVEKFQLNPYLSIGKCCDECGKTYMAILSRRNAYPDFEEKWDELMNMRQKFRDDITEANGLSALEHLLKGRVLQKGKVIFRRMTDEKGVPLYKDGKPYMEKMEEIIEHVGIDPDPKVVLDILKKYDTKKYEETETEEGGQIVTTLNVLHRDINEYNRRNNTKTDENNS